MHSIEAVSRLEVSKRWRGDTARVDDPNRPRGYSTPYDVKLSNKSSGKEEGRGDVCG